MPNWCYNRVEIHSEKEGAIRRFKDFVEDCDNPFSLYKIMPMPKKVAASMEPDPNHPHVIRLSELRIPTSDDWYHWRNNMWGVKWDTSEPNGEDGRYAGLERCSMNTYETYLVYNFDTPWGPPNGIYRYLADDGLEHITRDPEATIRWYYHEWGMGAEGYLSLQD